MIEVNDVPESINDSTVEQIRGINNSSVTTSVLLVDHLAKEPIHRIRKEKKKRTDIRAGNGMKTQ